MAASHSEGQRFDWLRGYLGLLSSSCVTTGPTLMLALLLCNSRPQTNSSSRFAIASRHRPTRLGVCAGLPGRGKLGFCKGPAVSGIETSSAVDRMYGHLSLLPSFPPDHHGSLRQVSHEAPPTISCQGTHEQLHRRTLARRRGILSGKW